MVEIVSPLKTQIQAGDQVRLSETRTGLLHIRGKAAAAPLNAVNLAVGDVTQLVDGLLARLRRDEFTLLTDNVDAASTRLAPLMRDMPVTLTDITHGRCVLTLTGARAGDVLPKVCALDFGKLANRHAAQTSLAKVRALIVRDDGAEPAYHIVVDRSLAAYVWDVLADAVSHP